jgi:UDP-GlcNAc:undecaprenyl-phosphate/decaprenyl-phosphate GlcNAc-1-phosphate transferase
MGMAMFFSFMGSLIICMALIPALSASAWRLQIIDVPRGRHTHREPVAKVGGIAFALATFAAVLIWAPKDPLILSSLLGGAVILLFGMWDDRTGLGHRTKFIGQILAAAVVIGLAGIRLSALPFGDDALLPAWAAVPLTMMAIVGVTNAVNLSDGLDGLAGGLSVISFAGIAYLAYQANEPLLVLLMVSVLGALLGFLRFNTYPARIFMGDAGSQFLGHYLAVAGILLTDATRTIYSPMLALFIWGVPLLDTVGVIGQRLFEGRSPFVGDRNHIHHKLLAAGCTHGQAVTLIYVVHGLMVSCAYVLRWQSDAVLAAVYLLFAAAVCMVFVRTPALGRQTTFRPASEARLGRAVGEWPVRLLAMLVPVYLMASVLIPREVPSDAGWIAAGLAIAVLASLSFHRATPWIVRAALYIGSTCLLYYGEIFPRPGAADMLTPMNAATAVLGVLVILTIRFVGEDRFQTTPLDYLIVLLAGALPFLPEMTVGDAPAGVLAAKLMIVFFAFELLLHMRASAVTRLGLVSLAMLAGLLLRAWW